MPDVGDRRRLHFPAMSLSSPRFPRCSTAPKRSPVPYPVLLNNGGMHLKKAEVDTSDFDFASVMEKHVFGAFALTREAERRMIARSSGSILFTVSLAAFHGHPVGRRLFGGQIHLHRSGTFPVDGMGTAWRPRQRNLPVESLHPCSIKPWPAIPRAKRRFSAGFRSAIWFARAYRSCCGVSLFSRGGLHQWRRAACRWRRGRKLLRVHPFVLSHV